MNNSANPTNSAFAVLINKAKSEEKHYIFQDKSLIGRNKDAFICICDSKVSRNHCVIERTEDNRFFISDMSLLGTFVNNHRILRDRPQELKNFDTISLVDDEDHSFLFYINSAKSKKNSQTRNTHSHLAQKMIDLNSTQTFEKENLNKMISELESERCSLQNRMEALKSGVQDSEYEFNSLSSSTSKYKEELEKKLKDMEENNLIEKQKSKEEVEIRIAEVMKKVEDLQNTKYEMEARHKMEREEMETRCRSEVDELKKKLAESEAGQEQVQLQLKEIKNILMESELEQQRLFEEKLQAEKELESKVLSLTQEGEKKSQQLEDLENKLKRKEELEEAFKKEIEALEDDMQCSICAELYIEPTALNCGHMFCKACIEEWKKKKNVCPMCRTKIVTTIRVFVMDTFIERNIRLMSEEAKLRRDAIINERTKGKSKGPAKKKKKPNTDVSLPGTSRTRQRDVTPNDVVAHVVVEEPSIDQSSLISSQSSNIDSSFSTNSNSSSDFDSSASSDVHSSLIISYSSSLSNSFNSSPSTSYNSSPSTSYNASHSTNYNSSPSTNYSSSPSNSSNSGSSLN